MAAGYFAAGKQDETGTFELTVRRLPKHRDFVVIAGIHRAVEYLLNLRFEPAEISYLHGLANFRNVPGAFWEYLANFRFMGDVFAVPEGTVLYEGQPILNIRAKLAEGQIPETFLLSAITFETLIATKAALVTHAAAGRDVVEFGTRRAHTPEAGVLGARAAYIGGCAGTSNVLAGFKYGIPVMGTAAHSWILAFASETEAFRELQKLLGDRTVQLLDTYDTVAAARKVAELGGPLWGVRLDSGDFIALSRQVRGILDAAGLTGAKIMASGDLEENRIAEIVAAGAPIDMFGVGTELATSADAPSMGAIYKLVEIEAGGKIRYTAKHSPEKGTLPGAKQLFRYSDSDLLALHDECAGGSEAMLKPLILGGELVSTMPAVDSIRTRVADQLRHWPDGKRTTGRSHELVELTKNTR